MNSIFTPYKWCVSFPSLLSADGLLFYDHIVWNWRTKYNLYARQDWWDAFWGINMPLTQNCDCINVATNACCIVPKIHFLPYWQYLMPAIFPGLPSRNSTTKLHKPHLTFNEDHHHGEAFAPFGGMGSVGLLDSTQGQPVRSVGNLFVATSIYYWNWARTSATMVAETASIVDGCGQNDTN